MYQILALDNPWGVDMLFNTKQKMQTKFPKDKT